MRKKSLGTKLGSLFFCLLLFISTLVVIAPQKTFADAGTEGSNPRIEFEAFVAATYLKSCMVKASSEYPGRITGEWSFNDADLFRDDGYFQDYDMDWLNDTVGGSFGAEIACTKRSDILSFVEKVGFEASGGKDALYTMLLKVYDCSKKNVSGSCPAKYQGDVGEIYSKVIIKQMEESSLLGPDNDIALSNAAKYYGLRDAWSDSRICNGKLAEQTEYDLADSDKRKKATEYNGLTKFQYVQVDTGKLSREYDYAIIETNRKWSDNIIHRNMEPSGKDARGNDWDFIDKELGSSTCEGILSDIVRKKDTWGKEYGDAVAALLSQGIEVDPNDYTSRDEECEAAGGALAWLTCPITRAMSGAIQFLQGKIEGQLIVRTEENSPDLNLSSIEKAWSRVRSIALLLLVPIMLIMVITTALGLDIIDAYTVKRTLPRLAIAVILITLSFDLMQFGISIINSIGAGVKGIILQPFPGLSDRTFDYYFDASLQAGTLIAGGAAFLAGVLSFGVLLPILFIMFLTILMGFLVLVARQALLYLLIIIAPLALVAWILPGTEKFWKIWWDNFTKLLLMYPLIMALIAAGRIGAEVIVQVGGEGNMHKLLASAAFVMPLFLIPSTFKAGGAFFGSLAGAAMGSISGIKKGLRGAATKNATGGWQRFMSGTGTGRLRQSGLVRRVGLGVGVGAKGNFGLGSKGEKAIFQNMTDQGEEALKDPSLVNLARTNDDAIAVLYGAGGSVAGAEAASQDLMAGWLQDNAEYQAATAALGTDPEDADALATQRRIRAEQEVRRRSAVSSARAAGINQARSEAAGTLMMQNKARSVAGGEAGRRFMERSLQRFGRTAEQTDRMRSTLQYWGREGGRGGDLGADTTQASFRRTGAAKVVRGHTTGLRAAASDIRTRYLAARDGGDYNGALVAASEMAALRNSIGQDVSQENIDIVYQEMQNMGINTESAASVDQQLAQQLSPTAAQQVSADIRNRAGLYERGEMSDEERRRRESLGEPPG